MCDPRVVEFLERIELPIVRRASRIGETGCVQALKALGRQDARQGRPAIGGLGLAIDGGGRRLGRALDETDIRLEHHEDSAIEIDPEALDFARHSRAIDIDQLGGRTERNDGRGRIGAGVYGGPRQGGRVIDHAGEILPRPIARRAGLARNPVALDLEIGEVGVVAFRAPRVRSDFEQFVVSLVF
jgi:hypothetical protein